MIEEDAETEDKSYIHSLRLIWKLINNYRY